MAKELSPEQQGRTSGEPTKTNPVRDRGLQFPDEESFRRGLGALDELTADGPMEHGIADGFATVLPEWVYQRVKPLLEEHNVPHTDVDVVPINSLSPEEQTKLRRGRTTESNNPK